MRLRCCLSLSMGMKTLLLTILLGSAAVGESYRELDWVDLLTDADREAMLSLPEIGHDNGPERDTTPEENLAADFTASIEQPAAREQWRRVLTATTVRAELDGSRIRIPGFLVPLETNAEGKTTEFFLVPYQGACIHVPPPPPNQLIHVRYPKGFQFEPGYLYEAFWIEGTLHTRAMQNAIASASYSMTVDAIRHYE